MNLALYARVSKANSDQNPEVQLSALRAWAASQGHTVIAEYVDHGWSGAKESRPALDRMIAAAEAKDFDAILVWKLDRFARSVKHLVTAIAHLEDLGVKFISLKDNLDLSTPTGRLMLHVLSAMAEFERDLIAERIKQGLKYTKEVNGNVPGRKVIGEGSRSTQWRRAKAMAAAAGKDE